MAKRQRATTTMSLSEAKARLDDLVKRGRAHLYKPIAIAEILFRNRVQKDVDLATLQEYRRKSYEWCRQIAKELYGRAPDLNSRYWDQMFDAGKLPPAAMVSLGDINRRNGGIVEAYVYGILLDRIAGILRIIESVHPDKAKEFDLSVFLSLFEEDKRFRRSVDKAYEIVVYALFNTVTKHLDAKVTLCVDENSDVLRDFEEFARLVLGVDRNHPRIEQPARLYRIGTANAADAGLDMWANFGPAVQVKHVSLTPHNFETISDRSRAEKLIIVCKSMEAKTISAVAHQLGLGDNLRGVITEKDLSRWYGLACGPKYCDSLGKDLLESVLNELSLEFPLTNNAQTETVHRFLERRGYDLTRLTGEWAIPE
ncbi:MAG: HaeII family restriction endonuclease [Pirellulales bacterium]|nr:HaeII family restriction endonuclease [Pirellulales bacterium]